MKTPFVLGGSKQLQIRKNVPEGTCEHGLFYQANMVGSLFLYIYIFNIIEVYKLLNKYYFIRN